MKCDLSCVMPDSSKSSIATRITGLTFFFLVIMGVVRANAVASSDKVTLIEPTEIAAIIISIISLLFSPYTLIRQKFQAETSSWNTALMRVGQLYDQAVQDYDLARLIREPLDRDGNRTPHLLYLSPKEDMWLANLFMAFEQIYVSISGASSESQRAWKQFLSNPLNKPTIRTAVLRDAQQFSDYHQDFLRFVCGRVTKGPDGEQYSGGVIKKDVISAALGRSLSRAVKQDKTRHLPMFMR